MAKDNPDVFGYVYLIRNNINGKVYIGKTTQSLSIRWSEHCSVSKNKSRSALHNAIRKYGRASFTMVEIARAFSEEELNEMETRAIWSHDSRDRSLGYNLTKGGEGITSYVAPDDVRRKVGAAAKAMWERPGFREDMRVKRRDRYRDPETLALHTKAMNTFCHREDYKAKHRSNSKAMWQDEDYRNRHKQAMRAVIDTPGYREKISAASRKRWDDPDFRAEQTAKRREMWKDPERKAAMLAKRKAARTKNSQVI